MGNRLTRIRRPPPPCFTEDSLPDLKGRVYIVTGASAGIGKELARLLYSHNGTVYITARSSKRANTAITWMKQQHPSSQGKLVYLSLDLNDLDSVKASATAFLAQETRLDVLFNNAGCLVQSGHVPKTKQGYELHLGANCLAPFLFTKLLTPLLVATAKMAAKEQQEKGGVRVVWVSSSAAQLRVPRGGIDMKKLDPWGEKPSQQKYGCSKAGNVLHAMEYQRRYGGEGVVSVSLHPGYLKTEITDRLPWWQYYVLKLILHPAVYGAYTELFAGLAPEAAALNEGEWIVPWGRIARLQENYRSEECKQNAAVFWKWCEEQVEQFT